MVGDVEASRTSWWVAIELQWPSTTLAWSSPEAATTPADAPEAVPRPLPPTAALVVALAVDHLIVGGLV